MTVRLALAHDGAEFVDRHVCAHGAPADGLLCCHAWRLVRLLGVVFVLLKVGLVWLFSFNVYNTVNP